MFREYRVNVTGHLLGTVAAGSTPRANVLEIVFDSALLRGRELVKQHEHEHDFISHQTESSRLPVRKAQCHWGWDWGPILITAGPWKPVLLETYVVRIDDVWWQGRVSDDLKIVKGKLLANTDASGKKALAGNTVTFELSLDGKVVFQSQSTTDDAGAAAVDFTLENPALWNPHGYGNQTLYELKASVAPSGQSKPTAFKVKMIGFRRCQLIQEPDGYGKSFYFRINNVDVFAGGSCWIPADSFLPRIGDDGYRNWMELMIEGNQIMTRCVRLLLGWDEYLTSGPLLVGLGFYYMRMLFATYSLLLLICAHTESGAAAFTKMTPSTTHVMSWGSWFGRILLSPVRAT